MTRVKASEIHYLEICGRKTRVVLDGRSLETSLSLDTMEQKLQELGFIRCHKSFLVNFRYTQSLAASALILSDGKEIPVSKHRIKNVRKRFFEYMQTL